MPWEWRVCCVLRRMRLTQSHSAQHTTHMRLTQSHSAQHKTHMRLTQSHSAQHTTRMPLPRHAATPPHNL
jgi:hypothetical protein